MLIWGQSRGKSKGIKGAYMCMCQAQWKMTSLAKWAILKIPLKMINLMINEVLKLVQSKRDYDSIIPM
jgi:hypothetical protein